jgi:hypothetical protein
MTLIFKNYEEFLTRTDKSVNGVSEEFANLHPNWDEQNLTNEGCWNCLSCENCIECSECENCIECSECTNWSWSNTFKVQMTCFN